MDTAQFANEAEYILEIIGIMAFAVSGSMLAVRKDFDVVGIVVLAGLTALGGGVVRDLLIGSTPPAAFLHLDYLLPPVLVALVAIMAHPALGRIQRSILVFDAVGVALFTVNGTLIASDAGLSPLAAAMVGVVTGIGGGVVRDVVARDVPLVVRRDSELLAIPSVLGALIVAFAHDNDAYSAVVGILAALTVFGLRAAAMTLGWRAPGAWRGRSGGEQAPGTTAPTPR
ncbi:MAG: trimeric intracellular cation channel family protein [Acidimicrobiales bacterium]